MSCVWRRLVTVSTAIGRNSQAIPSRKPKHSRLSLDDARHRPLLFHHGLASPLSSCMFRSRNAHPGSRTPSIEAISAQLTIAYLALDLVIRDHQNRMSYSQERFLLTSAHRQAMILCGQIGVLGSCGSMGVLEPRRAIRRDCLDAPCPKVVSQYIRDC